MRIDLPFDGAPLPAQPVGRLWTCPAGDHEGVILASWSGYWVHWLGKRSMPCGGDLCPQTRHRRPAYWVGYVPGYVKGVEVLNTQSVKTWRPFVIPLSSDHCHQLRAQVAPLTFPVRLTFMRRPGSRVVRLIDLVATKADERYPSFDILPTLWRVWGVVPPNTASAPDAQDFRSAADYEQAVSNHERNGRVL